MDVRAEAELFLADVDAGAEEADVLAEAGLQTLPSVRIRRPGCVGPAGHLGISPASMAARVGKLVSLPPQKAIGDEVADRTFVGVDLGSVGEEAEEKFGFGEMGRVEPEDPREDRRLVAPVSGVVLSAPE